MDLLSNEKNRRRLQWGIFGALYLAAAIFLLWKCRYGFGNADEAFYLTIARRLGKGDALFLHEWHLSQMAALLTMPIVWLYETLTGGTDGMILFMRYFATAVQLLLGFYLYLRLRPLSWWGAVGGSLCFVLYIPFGIMALSYNSMAIMGLVLAAALVLPGVEIRKRHYVLSGLSYAAAVLCCPYLIFVFALYLLAAALLRGKQLQGPWSVKGALWITAGAAALAALFLVFVLARAPLGDMVTAFSQILNDPEHPSLSLLAHTRSFLEGIVKATPHCAPIYSLLLLLFLGCLADRKRKQHRCLYFLPACVLTAALMLNLYRHIHYINTVMWSVNVLGVFVPLLSEKKAARTLFTLFWVPGMLYAFCLNMASNQHFYAVSSAASVAAVGSVAMTGLFARELWDARQPQLLRRLATLCGALVVAAQLMMQTDLRCETVFWETGMETQTATISHGLEAGLIVSPEWQRFYSRTVEKFENFDQYHPEKILFLSTRTWYYLLEDWEMAGYSSWLAGVNDHTLDRLEAYYQLNPDKLPDLVYADHDYAAEALAFAQRFGYRVESTADGTILLPPHKFKARCQNRSAPFILSNPVPFLR